MTTSKNKFLISFIVLVAVLLASAFGVYSFIKETQSPKLPVLGQIDHFVLTDSNGDSFDSGQLRGKVWVANFFFTTCSDICPIMTKNMASLSRTFEQIPAVKMVSFTVNPEYDSPEVLDAYRKKIVKVVEGNWHFLTGDRDKIRSLSVDQFKLGKVDEPIFHSPKFPLIDRSGYIRGYYDGTKTEEVNQLFVDANKLLKERF